MEDAARRKKDGRSMSHSDVGYILSAASPPPLIQIIPVDDLD